jgi:hypothetical protein
MGRNSSVDPEGRPAVGLDFSRYQIRRGNPSDPEMAGVMPAFRLSGYINSQAIANKELMGGKSDSIPGAGEFPPTIP